MTREKAVKLIEKFRGEVLAFDLIRRSPYQTGRQVEDARAAEYEAGEALIEALCAARSEHADAD